MTDDFFDERDARERRRAQRRRTAQRRRRLAALVAIVVAVVAVASLVVLNRSPGEGAAAGHSSTATEAGPATSPSPSEPPLRKPTKHDPLRAYFGGDSLAGMPGVMFAQRASRTGLMKVHADYQVSSRLTSRDPVDWPAHLRSQMAARRYDVGAFMIGINDTGMPMTVDGKFTIYPQQAWLDAYQRRADYLMRLMLQAGVTRVYWVGLPPMPKNGETDKVKRLNRLFEAAAAKHPDVVYVDAFTPLATESGGFDPSLRSGDGVHFTNEGATRIADAVWAAMKHDWHTQ